MVILDTNIIIDHLRQTSALSQLITFTQKHPQESLALSIISVQELYQGKSTAQETKEAAMLATVHGLQILPYTYETAELAGRISRDSEVLLEFPDAAIAATAILQTAPLLTFNQKHFASIPNLELFDF